MKRKYSIWDDMDHPVFQCKFSINMDHHSIHAAVLRLNIIPVFVNVIYFLDLSILHLSELFSNSFIEKVFLKLKLWGGGGGGGESTNFKITKL